ncbi:MAG: B12-binding domain-containing radical SAM protein [Magnetococcales bacterium]|nr:B12-binding domain-containing radical SAM protein [Magnetococcales bacterium]
MAEIIMIQPNTSLTGAFVRMVPLGVLYASSRIIKETEIDLAILDLRIEPTEWQKNLIALKDDKTRIVGFSVMSGFSISESMTISRWIRENWPDVKIVWGGPHPTFSPDDVLAETFIDYVVQGYGRDSFFDLVQNIYNQPNAAPLESIPGIGWRDNGAIAKKNPPGTSFEFIDYQQIPYHLIEDYSVYRHIDDEVVFPIYSVMGCPYKCGFCSTPAQLRNFRKKWVPYDVEQVVGHIRFLHENHGATYIYFIDEDSFVNLKHVEAIIEGVIAAGIDVKLGFRGARINEILKMDNRFLKMLVDAGTKSMHIGAECGSDRVLDLMEKNITVADILKANRILAGFPELRIFYNFIVGYPTETLEETKETRDLILKLMEENPSCFIIPLNKPRPLSNTSLLKLALEHDYVEPKTLEEWGKYDVESSDYNPEWLSSKHNRFIRMMFLSMYFIDNKIDRLDHGKRGVFFWFLKQLAHIYRPIALFRFKHGIDSFLVEDWVYRFLNKIMPANP